MPAHEPVGSAYALMPSLPRWVQGRARVALSPPLAHENGVAYRGPAQPGLAGTEAPPACGFGVDLANAVLSAVFLAGLLTRPAGAGSAACLPNDLVLPPWARAASSFSLSFFDWLTAEGCCADGLLRGEVNGRLDAMQGQIDSITNDVSDLRAQVDECRVPLEGNLRRDRDDI